MENALVYSPEIWADLDIYPITKNKYRISNAGKIFNIITNKMVPQHLNKLNGYTYVTLSLDNERKKSEFCVHRLVALVFIPNPCNKPQVNHLDKKISK